MCSRLLDALGFDMPTSEVILEHVNETFFILHTILHWEYDEKRCKQFFEERQKHMGG